MSAVHATTVVLGEHGVLIRGASGSGKTTLALALVTAALGAGRFARLVADDGTLLEAHHGRVIARPHPRLAGYVEVYGHGIAPVPHLPATRLALVVDLVPRAHLCRMPEFNECMLLGVRLPRAVAEMCNTIAASFAIAAVLPGFRLTQALGEAQRSGIVGAFASGPLAVTGGDR